MTGRRGRALVTWVRLFWDGANREQFRSVTPLIVGSSSTLLASATGGPAPLFLDEERCTE